MNIFIGVIIYIVALSFINLGLWMRSKAAGFSDKTAKIMNIVISIFLTVTVIYYSLIAPR